MPPPPPEHPPTHTCDCFAFESQPRISIDELIFLYSTDEFFGQRGGKIVFPRDTLHTPDSFHTTRYFPVATVASTCSALWKSGSGGSLPFTFVKKCGSEINLKTMCRSVISVRPGHVHPNNHVDDRSARVHNAPCHDYGYHGLCRLYPRRPGASVQGRPVRHERTRNLCT